MGAPYIYDISHLRVKTYSLAAEPERSTPVIPNPQLKTILSLFHPASILATYFSKIHLTITLWQPNRKYQIRSYQIPPICTFLCQLNPPSLLTSYCPNSRQTDTIQSQFHPLFTFTDCYHGSSSSINWLC